MSACAESCPVCKQLLDGSIDLNSSRIEVSCSNCGRCRISSIVARQLGREPIPGLSGWIRHQQGSDEDETPEIDREKLKTLKALMPAYSALEKHDIFLQECARRSRYPGAQVEINPFTDRGILWVDEPEEVSFLAQSLAEMRYIDCDVFLHGELSLRVLAEGWRRLQELSAPHPRMSQAFVAMAFQGATDDLWSDGIKPGVRAAGFPPIEWTRFFTTTESIRELSRPSMNPASLLLTSPINARASTLKLGTGLDVASPLSGRFDQTR